MEKTVNIGGYEVDKDAVWLYIQHFGKDKDDLWEWERQRKVLHDNIFNLIGIDRHSNEGIEFDEALNKFCEPHIMKYDKVTATTKELMRAKTDEEKEFATLKAQSAMMEEDKKKQMGFRNQSVDDENICRICGKDLMKDDVPKIADNLANVEGFDKINRPICLDCSENNPDEYNKAFKAKYWSK